MPNSHQTVMSVGEFEPTDINNATIANMVGAGGLSLAAGGPPPSAAPTRNSPTKCAKCCRFLRKVISFLLSHIGLLSLVVGYCIAGAFLFELLERENELMVKRDMTKNRLSVTDDLWAITKNMDVLKKDEWTSNVTNELRTFERSLITALKQKGWDGSESEDTVTWSFSGGLFYSITVITTIGYGHIAPKTPIAKIVTIFYAILGIPLTVLCWSNIGDAMANSFRFCYWRICCYVCTKKPKKRKRRATSRGRGSSTRGHSRTRSIRRSHRTSRSADTISDSLNSYSISDPDRFFDDGGTIADVQSFNTQIGSDGAPLSTTGVSRGIFQRNRTSSKRSVPARSSSQGPILQSPTAGSPVSYPISGNLTTPSTITSVVQQQPLCATQNNVIVSNVNKTNGQDLTHTSEYDSSILSGQSKQNTDENSDLNACTDARQETAIIPVDPSNATTAEGAEKQIIQNSTSISMKTETKKDNKKMSTFAVAKIGMKLKEKAKKKSLSSSASTKDPITTIEGGAFNETKNEISTAASGTTEAITVNSSTSSPTIIPSVSQSTKTLSGANQPGLPTAVPNRGSRPFSKLAMPTTSSVTQMTTGPASPSASNLISGMTPSVHQQPGQVYQTQSSQFVGGSIGLQQPPALRLERARPNEDNEWLEDPYYYEEYISEEEEEGEDYSTKNVPIWLSILLVLVYIGFGAYLFREWEEWTWLDSSYFCFITLTTIGFGDMVPDQKDTDGEVRIALTSLYLLFGIAMICMSFNLVQVQVINNVKNMGKQLGIIKDDRYDDDY